MFGRHPDATNPRWLRIRRPEIHNPGRQRLFLKHAISPASEKIADLQRRTHAATYIHGRFATLVQIVERRNRLLRGWMAAWEFCDIPPKVLTHFDHPAGIGPSQLDRASRSFPNQNALTPDKRKAIGLWTVSRPKSSRSRANSPAGSCTIALSQRHGGRQRGGGAVENAAVD